MYTRITPSNNGREAIQYARGKNGKGHNDNEHRNLLVAGINMLPDDSIPFEEQMDKYWSRASAQHKVQVRRIIGSFSKKELDPLDPNAKYIALQMIIDFVEKYYPDRQAAVFIQNDGVGENLHFHLIVNDCDMISAKGCSRDQQKYWYVEKNFDAVAEQYIQMDEGAKQTKDKKSQYERTEKQKSDEGKKTGYVWKDDLKKRIREAMEAATSREDFLKQLTARGVEGEYRATKKNGSFVLYELTDTSGFGGELPKKREYFKAKSHKLGSDYDIEELDEMIQTKQQNKTQINPMYEKMRIESVRKPSEQPQRADTSLSNTEVLQNKKAVTEPVKQHTEQRTIFTAEEKQKATGSSNPKMRRGKHRGKIQVQQNEEQTVLSMDIEKQIQAHQQEIERKTREERFRDEILQRIAESSKDLFDKIEDDNNGNKYN